MKKRTRHNLAFTVALVTFAAIAYLVFVLFGTWSSSLNARHAAKTPETNIHRSGTNNENLSKDTADVASLNIGAPISTSTFVNADPAQGSALADSPPALIIRFAQPLGPSSLIRVFDALDRPVHLGVVTFSDDRQAMTIGLLSTASGPLRVAYTACGVDNTGCEDGSYAFTVAQ